MAHSSAAEFDPTKDNIKWDEGNPLRTPDPNRVGVISFTPKDYVPKSSGHSLGVWRKDTKAYKLFDTGDNKKPFNDVKKAIETAEENALPIAGARAAEGLVYTYEISPYKVRYGFAIVATYYEKPWVWFDGQGNWEAKFEEIVAPATHNALLGMQRDLKRAVTAKLSDPQGFINPTTQSKTSIQFVDLNIGSDKVVQEMLKIVEKYLKW
ncbi:hypothetical protein GYMLUDRAFT_244811 [Collybiopsis luxurians FD-317 M1]|uniref:Unplaced genomic scaffold GYMLUscaffold_29, whole genome shotgun sequence n=1 Tax=Collybiopsis luxurians FD-317 M1 TaxID=944289 RepID=A0A0D0CC22_9AGAR|nr:hypothetical protein GYMLUDRAFT_244811 [Collybiopsis luxurians FD-317 M1]